MIELKRCPFCGGEAIVEQEKAGEYTGDSVAFMFSIRCKKCNSTTPGARGTIAMNLTKTGEFNIWLNEMNKAAEAWNRRAE